MYEDIVFQEGVDLGAIPKNNYQPGNLTAIGKFDFKGIKGNIYGKASTPYTTIELYAPKDWFKEKPDFGYRMRGEGIGPYRLEPDKEYYRLPDAGLYNDAFYEAAASEKAAKEMIYESMANVLQEYIPQIFEAKLKISPKDQKDKLTVYVVTDYTEAFSPDPDLSQLVGTPAAIYVDRKDAEKKFKSIFDSCKTDGNVYTNEDEDTISYEDALKAGEFTYFMSGDAYYGQAKLSRHELILSKDQQKAEDVDLFMVQDLRGLPGDSAVKIFTDESEALQMFKDRLLLFEEDASNCSHVGPHGLSYCWEGDDCGVIEVSKENIKLKNRVLDKGVQDKGLLMEELRKHKPIEIIKKSKLQYLDISKLGEYYYKLAEIKNNPILPDYDNDREIIKEMLRDGFTESRVCLVFWNIEDRRNIPHKDRAAIILKDPAMDKYKAFSKFRQNFRKMVKQR